MNKYPSEVRLTQLCIIASILSQIEPLTSLMRPIMTAMWVLILTFYLLKYHGKVALRNPTLIYIGGYAALLLVSAFVTLFAEDHLSGNYVRIMSIPLLVSIVGDFFSRNDQSAGLQTILKTYLLTSVAYAAWVNVTYFASYSAWLEQNVYTFLLKNSAAQIWSVGILIALFLIKYETRFQKYLGYAAAFYLFLMCGISQCRTAILALAVVLVVYVLLNSKHPIRWSFFIALIGLLAWNTSFSREFINQSLFLMKYEGADLNRFSSGRLDAWAQAINTFIDHPFFGTGKYYVDCSYIMVLAETGITGFILVEGIWISIVITNFQSAVKRNIKSFLLCITVFYLVESILEGYPPFGPGVSSFMFWFLSAVFSGNAYKNCSVTAGEIHP